MTDSHLFRLAREASFQSDYSGNAHIGAIVVYKGCVLAKGSNSDKTHTVQARYNKWRYKNGGNRYLPDKAHAELAALSKVKYLDIDWAKVHVYVYRELRDGSLAAARPCEACMAAIRRMGIHHIHYTTSDGFCHEKLL